MREQAFMRLFCFTYAGGNATFYDQIEKEAEGAFKVVKLEYAGHGNRHKESFYRDFPELAEDLYSLLKLELKEADEYALFGYSMGSISVVEVLKKIIKLREIRLPVHVFLAAHEPHTKRELKDYSSGELDELVKLRTVRFGAVPEKLIDNKSFWRVYLPVYRADYSMIGGYRFEDLELRTDISLTVFYSEADTPYSEMVKWKNYFTGSCQFFEYEGNHFFINDHLKNIVGIIKKELET